MNIKNKSIFFLGSSVTYGDGGVSFAEMMGEEYGCNVIKEAVSGTTLADIGENSYVSRLKKVPTDQKFDLCICQISTNDSWQKVDFQKTKEAGYFIIDYVKKNFNCPVAFYSGTYFDSEGYKETVQWFVDNKESLGIYLLDLFFDEEFNDITDEQRREYMKDHVHPTVKGYREWWLPRFKELCDSIENVRNTVVTNIRGLRDPFILFHDGVYFAYGTEVISGDWENTSWGCYVNEDGSLDGEWKHYDGELYIKPKYATKNLWAPEVHKYKDKFYMFATYYSSETAHRGCTILKADSPLGPFIEITDGHITPKDRDCIDGTLYVDEADQPYMIFVHEWTCTPDGVGRMDVAKLSDDLTHFISEPTELFRADDAPWADGIVTDGCFMHKAENGELLMLWSNFYNKNYCQGIARSKSGDVFGPWEQDENLLFSKDISGEYDGGHGMFFRDTKGDLYLSLHSPNHPNEKTEEQTLIISITEQGGRLIANLK